MTRHGLLQTAIDEAREQVENTLKAFLAAEKSFVAEHANEDIKKYAAKRDNEGKNWALDSYMTEIVGTSLVSERGPILFLRRPMTYYLYSKWPLSLLFIYMK